MGLRLPPPPAATPVQSTGASSVSHRARLAAEAVVYAAAEALDASPRAAKAAVVAAFSRAPALGVGVDVFLAGLRDE